MVSSPEAMRTIRQPPNRGDSQVAAEIAPSMKPVCHTQRDSAVGKGKLLLRKDLGPCFVQIERYERDEWSGQK